MPAKLTLSLQRQFLRTRMRGVRVALDGKKRVVQLPKLPISTVVYKKDSNKPIDTLDNIAVQKSMGQQKTDVVMKQQPIQKTAKPRRSKLRVTLFTFFTAISLTLLTVLFAPVAYYSFFSADPVPIKASESGTPLGGEYDKGTEQTRPRVAEPAYNENLPEGNWLIISKIGVRTQLLESENPEESLKEGVWRVPEFGQPGDQTKPMILAAHRFGYNWWWKGEYWKYHSFYLLPDTKPGDIVEVISNKRKYVYEIYAGEEGTEISDYNADLILYTCKFLNSDVRHFRYARMVDPNRNSQQGFEELPDLETPISTPSAVPLAQ